MANDTIPVSIVIPTLNEERYLPALLESLRASTSSPLDIIVVDGNSADGTAAVVERFHSFFTGASSLRLLHSPRNISLQRNAGAREAKYNLLIFCDADVVFPSPKAFEHLVNNFIQKKYVAANPTLTSLEPGLQFKLVYSTYHFLQRFFLLFNKPYLAGACMLTTKEVFEKVGGFNPQLLLGEDVDYSLRAQKLGRCGLINVFVKVSSRRFIKYGYGWILKETPNLVRFFITGRVVPETIYYPFGEFGGQQAHYVTKNTGKES